MQKSWHESVLFDDSNVSSINKVCVLALNINPFSRFCINYLTTELPSCRTSNEWIIAIYKDFGSVEVLFVFIWVEKTNSWNSKIIKISAFWEFSLQYEPYDSGLF
jgi:hypothetical protein